MTNGDDSVYPTVPAYDDQGFAYRRGARSEGLTKREYFAAMAMQGVFSRESPTSVDEIAIMVVNSVKIADALIAALNKKESKEASHAQ